MGAYEKILFEEEKPVPKGPRYRYDTVGHAILDIEKSAGLRVTDEEYKTLNKLIELASNLIKERNLAKQNPKEIFSAIFDAIESQNFSCGENTLHFSTLLRTKVGDCDTLSHIYLSVADALDFPIFPVVIYTNTIIAPTHMFIRWDPDGRHSFLDQNNLANKGDLNWEPTSGSKGDGAIIDDNFYINSYSGKKGYLKTLSRDSMLSLVKFISSEEESEPEHENQLY